MNVNTHSILATADFVAKIPLIALIGCGAILLLAFIIGCKKGFRRVSWGGLFWLIAGVGFVVGNRFLCEKNPLVSVFERKFRAGSAEFLSSVTLALAVATITLLLYGGLSLLLRPKMKWVKSKEVEYDDYGFEYEVDDEDEENADETQGKKLLKKGYGKPSVFSRIVGGFTCLLNTATVLGIVLAPCLLLVGTTSLNYGLTGNIFRSKIASYGLKFSKAFFIDFLAIGLMLAVAYRGYKVGFINSLRIIFVYLGGLALVGTCFALPFTGYAQRWNFLRTVVGRSSSLFLKILPSFGVTLGKLFTGFLATVISIALLVLLDFALRKLDGVLFRAKFTRILDGVLSAILWLIVGAVIVGVALSVAYTLEEVGICNASKLFNSKSAFGNGFYGFADAYLQPWIEKLATKLT
jgi:hypothetical protein